MNEATSIIKKKLRNQVRANILALTESERKELDLMMKAHFTKLFDDLLISSNTAHPIVLTYMPLPDEPDISNLLQGYPDVAQALPISLSDGTLSLCLCDSGISSGMFGIIEPDKTSTVIDCEAIDFAIIPGRAFGKKGERLGRGKGYYDRFLASSHCITFGLCYDEQVFDIIPMDSHDCNVNYVITPTTTYTC